LGGNTSKRVRGDVGQGVDDPGIMVCGRGHGPIALLEHCQPFEEVEGDGGGTTARHACGPCHCRQIVEAYGNLGPLHGRA
jgi:hypothetical protein